MRIHTEVYDLAVGPVSYDFATWLIAAEMARRASGADLLHVVIQAKPDGIDGWFRDKTALYPSAEMHWRLWHLVMPLCRLVNASVELVPDGQKLARQTLSHHAGPIIAAARAGAEVPRFSAGEHALDAVRRVTEGGRAVVTMTLRDTYEPGRNADARAWYGAAKDIEARGYTVVMVHDTSRALAMTEGFFELNVELRMALYQSAALNLHSHGGPATLSWFSDAPWIMFCAAMPEQHWRTHWAKHLGLQWGDQFPWSRPDQRLVYETDQKHVILREFERWAGATN